jgi:hypothetical protein
MADSIENTDNSKGIPASAEYARTGWDEQFKAAIANGDVPESDLFENAENEFDKAEWQWK